MQPLVIYGAKGHAREIADLLDDVNADRPCWEVLGFLTDDPAAWETEINGRPILGGRQWLERASRDVAVVVAIGSTRDRHAVVESLRPLDRAYPTVCHPTALVSRHARVGRGTQLTAGCIVTPNADIGEFVLLNRGSNVSHDCRLGPYVTVAPGVHLSGNVTVGTGCDIGTGASIIQGVSVGEWTVVGAGAAVIRDLPAHCTAVGVPARVLLPPTGA